MKTSRPAAGEEEQMGRTITAIYENGVLRPLEPLPLPEHAQVELDLPQVVAAADPAAQRERVRYALADAGLLAEAGAAQAPAHPLTNEERAQRAQTLADAGVPPLSAAILDERAGR
jgi:predicted DNA-binding antitoxin AbrB/MazE fold protein